MSPPTPAAAPARWLERADGLLAGKRARLFALALVLVLAALLRAVYFAQASETHGFARPMVDSAAYVDHAEALRAGEWPSGKVFFVDPLYAYLLAGHFALFGDDPAGVLVAQMVLGVLHAGLLFLLAASILRPAEALLAGLLAAGYPVLLFYEGLVLKTSVSALVLSGVLLALVHARRRGPLLAGVAGLLLGLGVLLRGNLLALAPVAAVWLAWTGGDRARRVRSPLALFAGVAIALAPVTLHNLRAGDLVLTTSNAGQNLYVGNGPQNETGGYVAPPGVRSSPVFEEEDFARLAEEELGRELAPSEVSGFWMRKALAAVRDDPGRAARLLGRKLLLLVNRTEVADNANYGVMRESVPLLRLPLPTFDLLLVGAVLALCLRRWTADDALLVAIAATVGASVALFFVLSRFRLAAVPPLIVLCASLPGALAAALARPRLLRWGVALVLTAATIGATRLGVYEVSRTMRYYNDALLAVEDGDPELAVEYLERSLAEDEANWRAHLLRGQLLADLGADDEAEGALREAARRAPGKAEPRFRLGLFLDRRGDPEGAERALVAALERDPVHDLALLRLADLELRTGRPAAARERLTELLARRPRKGAALGLLGVAHLEEGHYPEAEGVLGEAIRRQPGNAGHRLALARCYRLQGRDDEARVLYEEILTADPGNARARNGLRALGDGQ